MRSSYIIALVVILITMVAGRSFDRSYLNALARSFDNDNGDLEQDNMFLRRADDGQDEYETLLNDLRNILNKRIALSKFRSFKTPLLVFFERIE